MFRDYRVKVVGAELLQVQRMTADLYPSVFLLSSSSYRSYDFEAEGHILSEQGVVV